MFAQGLLDEVRGLLMRPETLGQTARQGLGYKEVIDWLEQNTAMAAGNLQPAGDVISNCKSHSEGISFISRLIQTRTRQFAKRQHTWFRNLEEAHPIEISGQESPSEIANTLMRIMSDPATRSH
jgi:tRNA dimethylallyltransferase